jgi:hypothetical protein
MAKTALQLPALRVWGKCPWQPSLCLPHPISSPPLDLSGVMVKDSSPNRLHDIQPVLCLVLILSQPCASFRYVIVTYKYPCLSLNGFFFFCTYLFSEIDSSPLKNMDHKRPSLEHLEKSDLSQDGIETHVTPVQDWEADEEKKLVYGPYFLEILILSG